MHYSAYRGMLCLNATIYALFLERRRGRKAEKKATECCRIFGFDSPCQFIFNALS